MIRGVWQLQRLTLVHCKSGGSSRGAREFIDSRLPQFAAANPQLALETRVRGNRHPFLQAEYVNGVVKELDVKNETAAAIAAVCESLRNQTGRRLKRRPLARSRVDSLQGMWNPSFNHLPAEEQLRRRVMRESVIIGVAPPSPAAAAAAAAALPSSAPLPAPAASAVKS